MSDPIYSEHFKAAMMNAEHSLLNPEYFYSK